MADNILSKAKIMPFRPAAAAAAFSTAEEKLFKKSHKLYVLFLRVVIG